MERQLFSIVSKEFHLACIIFGIASTPLSRFGGILVGLNSQNILVKSFITGDLCVRFHLSSKINRFEWSSVLIYGTSQNTQKATFWLRWFVFAMMILSLC
jgi:hypothetical protein